MRPTVGMPRAHLELESGSFELQTRFNKSTFYIFLRKGLSKVINCSLTWVEGFILPKPTLTLNITFFGAVSLASGIPL